MFRKSSDLLVVGVIAVLAALLEGVGLLWPLGKAVLGLPMVLFVPGYACVAALFPPGTLGKAERLLFSVGLSLVVTMLGSLALYGLHLELRPVTWAVLLAVITLGASLVAWRRRPTVEAEPLALNLSRMQAGTLSLAGLVVVASLALARVPSGPAGLEGYTILSILPADTPQAAAAVRLGISSMEFVPVGYHLRLTMDDQVIYEWISIGLQPGEQWEQVVALPNPGSAPGQVEARLYRLDHPEVVYRRVTLALGAALAADH
jgi:uncharacterized membrane protein